ncbi:hypothetical protein HDU93_004210, partial [Gonapodya sp. JEL0774]
MGAHPSDSEEADLGRGYGDSRRSVVAVASLVAPTPQACDRLAPSDPGDSSSDDVSPGSDFSQPPLLRSAPSKNARMEAMQRRWEAAGVPPLVAQSLATHGATKSEATTAGRFNDLQRVAEQNGLDPYQEPVPSWFVYNDYRLTKA